MVVKILKMFGVIIWTLCHSITQATIAHGSDYNYCPKACHCDGPAMNCGEGYWDTFPRPVYGVTKAEFYRGNFRSLEKPHDCDGYKQLQILNFHNTNISSMDQDALFCFPRLRVLSIYDTVLKTLPKHLFESTPDLTDLSIQESNLTVSVIPTLCLIPNLKDIDLHRNKLAMNETSLTCLGSLSNLSSVNFGGNVFSGFLNRTLKPLRKLSKFIGLSDCRISHLQEDTFLDFQAEELDLSFNPILSISKDVFHKMTNLERLNLEWTGIGKLSQRFMAARNLDSILNQMESREPALQLPESIQELKLINNDMPNLVQGAVTDFPNLRRLQLSLCGISYVEATALSNLPRLEQLSVLKNRMSNKMIQLLLAGVSNSSLSVLHLSSNPIKTLNRTFAKMTENKLTEVYLGFCKINVITPGTFDNLINLQTLYLSNNRLHQLTGGLFKPLVKLKSLFLANNALQEFDGAAIGLDSTLVANLELGNNVISEISLMNVTTLENIHLSLNRLEVIPCSSWRSLASLTKLKITHNSFAPYASHATCAYLPNLVFLDLANSRYCEYILKDLIVDAKNLKTLDMSGCILESFQLNRQQWFHLPKLTKIELNECQINQLPPGMFTSLESLERVRVTSNHIPFLEPSAFPADSNITHLDLRNNLLTLIQWESTINLPRLRYLNIAENPLHCTCDLLWVFQALNTPHLTYIDNGQNLICNSPAKVRSVRMRDLSLTVHSCESLWVNMLLSLALAASFILVLGLLITIWRKRWHIRYTFFLARAGIGRYEEMCDKAEYTYDAFLAYSSEDLEWVTNKLLPQIDSEFLGDRGFKLCLHHRDWLAGIDIAENITKSIAESRRVILVLSPHFAASEWCRFELAMTYLRYNAENHQKHRLIVLLKGHIPDHLLTPRIVHILATKTYLKWPPDKKSQEQFYKTLHKSLKKELLYSNNQNN